MTKQATEASLAALLADVERRHPLRAGSLIVTVFGDAIVPRGGTLWLGSLLEIMGLFGVDAGLVRTALSRLVQENWFARHRAGKNSYYRLSAEGDAKFRDATQRIYHAQEPAWEGMLRLALLSALDTPQRTAAREALAALGFGQAGPTLMLRPETDLQAQVPQLPGLIWLTSRLDEDADAARALGASAWQLDPVAASYTRFIETFGRLQAKPAGAGWDDASSLRLRILLVHEYRRIILRDPMLPCALLPRNWPGLEARALCRTLYRRTLERSERWLGAHGTGPDGVLPPADAGIAGRFTDR